MAFDVLDAAPEDDEPLSPEEEAAIQAGIERYMRGGAIPLDQLLRECQLWLGEGLVAT